MTKLIYDAARLASGSTVGGLKPGGRFIRPSDGTDFERLVRDLFARQVDDESIDLNGRSGQAQAGIDIWYADREGRLTGIQCKVRSDASSARRRGLTQADLRAEVGRARNFNPPIDRFVLVTTGPNDTRLQEAARILSAEHAAQGLFSVEFHGWDWIEGLLTRHPEIAVHHGLAATVREVAVGERPGSRIAREIGGRLRHAHAMINAGREGDGLFTLQGLARRAGHADWRRLEQIVDGIADADEAELSRLANALGLGRSWLIEGKGTPFLVDDPTAQRKVEEIYDAIVAMTPQRIMFVRQREGRHGQHDAFIAVERDELRWFVFRAAYPACDSVGATGARDLFDLCRLMRRLYHADPGTMVVCHGGHLGSPEFERVLEGEVHPGSILGFQGLDRWWEGFAALRPGWVEGAGAHWASLRRAVAVVERQIERAREAAETSRHWRDALAWGRLRGTKASNGDGEPWP